MRNWLRISGLAFGLGATALVACVSDDNAAPGVTTPDASLEGDAAPVLIDAATPINDAGITSKPDATVPPSDDGGGVVPDDASFVDVLAPSSWSAFNTASLDAGLIGFGGATFDGRYAYFAPASSAGGAGTVARLDTQQAFDSPSAWTTFSTLSVIPGAGSFAGTIFDGQYIYFVPFTNNISTVPDRFDQTVVRYDTHSDFTTGSSWAQFDAPASGPFVGGTFDGRYVHLASHLSTTVVSFDTQGTFTSESAWTAFDTSTLTPPVAQSGIEVFSEAIFDGTYVYFVGPVVARRNTKALPDAGASAWETFKSPLTLGEGDYESGGFDGRYLYIANNGNSSVARFDTQGAFTAASSWTTFDASTAGGGTGGYYGMGFDGSKLYFAPNGTTVMTYDVQAPFASASSWTSFDTSKLATAPYGYETVLFDGQYLYAAAYASNELLRLTVKSGPGSIRMLPEFHGSFY